MSIIKLYFKLVVDTFEFYLEGPEKHTWSYM